GAWIAVINRRDEYHVEAAAFYERLLREKRPLVTTNLVIAEAYAMIRRYTGYRPAIGFLDSIRQSSRLTKVYANAELELEAEMLLRRYADQDFSLTDAVSFVVMRQRDIAEAFTFDGHFAAAGFTVVPMM
ncbi:MAG: PIN domain-containing protein, partial [Anaerolineae bacterium]